MYKTSHKNITDLRSEIVRFAEIHFAQQMEGYDGYIGIKSRRGKYFKNEYTPKQSCFDRHIMKYQHFGQRDLYISKNIHTGFCVSKKNILEFYNIVVDIDAHGALPEHLAEDTPKLLHFLQTEVFGQDGVPVPNTIVYSGRGIQLWYAIDSLAASMADQYILASRFIAGKIHEAISSSPMLDLYSVDMAASCKTAGLCRMPGTFNSSSNCYGMIQFIHDKKLNVLDFCNYEIDPPKQVKPAIWKDGYTGIAQHRREMIEKLLQIRLEDGDDCKGMRDLFCFVYFCAGFSGDIDEAYEATKRLNRRFPQPLS